MDKDKALQMCLEYIETDAEKDAHERKYVRLAIKQALAAPVQEPVAWIWKYANGEEEVVFVPPRHVDASHVDAPSTITPLYTAPPAQPAPDLQAELEATNRQVEILSDALAESRREVAALKAVQEPVAWCSQCGHTCPQTVNQEPVGWWDAKIGFFEEKHFDQLCPLYTTPPAAEFTCSTGLCHYKAVPDAMTSADIQEHIEYVAGWNDYRAAMMEMMK
jgi:hypothetical protein